MIVDRTYDGDNQLMEPMTSPDRHHNPPQQAVRQGHPALPDPSSWIPYDNVVRDRVLVDNGSADDNPDGLADLAVAYHSGTGDCFEDNDLSSSAPPAIEDAYACDGGPMT